MGSTSSSPEQVKEMSTPDIETSKRNCESLKTMDEVELLLSEVCKRDCFKGSIEFKEEMLKQGITLTEIIDDNGNWLHSVVVCLLQNATRNFRTNNFDELVNLCTEEKDFRIDDKFALAIELQKIIKEAKCDFGNFQFVQQVIGTIEAKTGKRFNFIWYDLTRKASDLKLSLRVRATSNKNAQPAILFTEECKQDDSGQNVAGDPIQRKSQTFTLHEALFEDVNSYAGALFTDLLSGNELLQFGLRMFETVDNEKLSETVEQKLSQIDNAMTLNELLQHALSEAKIEERPHSLNLLCLLEDRLDREYVAGLLEEVKDQITFQLQDAIKTITAKRLYEVYASAQKVCRPTEY